MSLPDLTFFCELEHDALENLLEDSLISKLKSLNARISMGLLDMDVQRAEVVRRLNKAGIPVVAWLLLSKEEGYWLNLRNSGPAFRRYLDFLEWTEKEKLLWDAVGLDIEPDIREIAQLAHRNWQILPEYARRITARMEWLKGIAAYQKFVHRIRKDGFNVETYQLPLIEDERKVRSTLLQRLFGVVDISADREVLMLYSSFFRPNGAGMIASYAPQAQCIAVGSTGGGVDVEFGDFQPLSWEEFSNDLRLAWYWCNDLYVFSLEGCVRQGFIDQLEQLEFDYPLILPEASTMRVDGWRRSLQSVLWFFSHLTAILGLATGALILWKGVSRLIKTRPRNQA